MKSHLVAGKGFNLFLLIICLFALPIYLVAMLIAFPLSRFEKPDPFVRLFSSNKDFSQQAELSIR
ncbi:MAG: hypothetical protein H6Q43_2401 [Deltaproteobacteria bacterium]|nr:hypothetical protein [Deltaproteobacteria bacterium]MBP1718963.1 hypothetical protein [Deltaproteobacteria bacterium]